MKQHLYILVSAETDFTKLNFPTAPFAVFIIDPDIQTPDTQWELSHALVEAGCRAMAAWGPDSTQWDDSGDYAALLTRDNAMREPDYDMMTTWHDKEPLKEAFDFFCLNNNLAQIPVNETHLILEFGEKFGAQKVQEIVAQFDA